jgi:rhamnosyltransferase
MSITPDISTMVSAVVITYRPDRKVLENLCRLSLQIARVIVVDNGSEGDSVQVVEAVERVAGVELIRNGSNLGIATALNIGIRRALQGGARWVATFDQDSAVPEDYFKNLFGAYEKCPDPEKVGMLAPRSWSETVAKIFYPGQPAWGFALDANTSGSVIKSEVFRESGFYDDALFIDYVDIDFCLRLQKHGYKILKVLSVVLEHQLGSTRSRNLLGLKVSYREHIPWRYYYMMRNRVLVHRRFFFTSPRWVLYDIGWFCYGSAKMLLENDRRKKMRALLEGLRDGLVGKTGRHPEFPPDPSL